MTQSTIELEGIYEEFARREVAIGRFVSVSDVVRAGHELLQEREGRLAKLRALIEEAERASLPPPPPLPRR